jgi:hypothetical protein
MSKTKKPTKALALVAVQALIAGTQKRFPSAQFTIGNVVYTSAQLVTLMQSVADAMTKETAAQKAARDAVTELKNLQAQAHPVILEYRRQLDSMFGSASQVLADFGMLPRKARTPLTVDQKAAAKAKRDATLAAKGKKPSAKATSAAQGTTAAPAQPAPAVPAATPAKPTP